MSESVKNWLATGIVLVGVLVICDWLDRPVPTECATTLTDGGGNSHEFIGKIKFACPIAGACRG